ncbi:hypothetical protein IQ06DRAFT_10760 [Phaeosphaeriaceae sp. SRC1lsM3a]|nr:hypothetical protein IQ06DRAFT_10760 [Stagonospora sp. SRC1lsM3a]
MIPRLDLDINVHVLCSPRCPRLLLASSAEQRVRLPHESRPALHTSSPFRYRAARRSAACQRAFATDHILSPAVLAAAVGSRAKTVDIPV